MNVNIEWTPNQEKKVPTVAKRRKKPTHVTIDEKLQALERLSRGESISEIAADLGVKYDTVRWWKNNSKKLGQFSLKNNNSSTQEAVNRHVDEAVFAWFCQHTRQGTTMNELIIKCVALNFYEEMGGSKTFRASDSWLSNWKRRYGITLPTNRSETLLTEQSGVQPFSGRLRTRMKSERLSQEQIFSCHDAGLNYKMLLWQYDATITEKKQLGLENKNHIAVMSCGNATGSLKLPLMVIVKSAETEVADKKDTPVFYRRHKTAWMDSRFFQEWFTMEFVPRVTKFLKEQGLPPKVLLIFNSTASYLPDNFNQGEIEVAFMMQHDTAPVNPSWSVWESLKRNYRYKLMNSILESQDNGFEIREHLEKMELRDVLLLLADSWERVAPPFIKKSWDKTWLTQECSQTAPEYEEPSTEQFLRVVRRIKGYQNVDEEDLQQWLRKDVEALEILTDKEIISMVLEEKRSEENNAEDNRFGSEAQDFQRIEYCEDFEEVILQKWIGMEYEATDPLADHSMAMKVERGEGTFDNCAVHGEIVMPVEARNFHANDASRDSTRAVAEQWIKKEDKAVDPLSNLQSIPSRMEYQRKREIDANEDRRVLNVELDDKDSRLLIKTEYEATDQNTISMTTENDRARAAAGKENRRDRDINTSLATGLFYVIENCKDMNKGVSQQWINNNDQASDRSAVRVTPMIMENQQGEVTAARDQRCLLNHETTPVEAGVFRKTEVYQDLDNRDLEQWIEERYESIDPLSIPMAVKDERTERNVANVNKCPVDGKTITAAQARDALALAIAFFEIQVGIPESELMTLHRFRDRAAFLQSQQTKENNGKLYRRIEGGDDRQWEMRCDGQ